MIVLTTMRWIFVPIKMDYQTIILGISSAILIIQLILFGGMLGYHIYFVCTNMTTIDWYCCKGKEIGHNYNYGLYTNIRAILGHPIFWILPVRFGVKGDGTDFVPTNLPENMESSISTQEEERKGLLEV